MGKFKMKAGLALGWIWLALAMPCIARADGDAAAGQAVFEKTCKGCHTIGRAAQHAFGPELNGLIGRKAGSMPGYKYSDEMQASGIVWSEANLTAFIAAPTDVVPGTRMHFWGLSDPQKVADLLAWLKANP